MNPDKNRIVERVTLLRQLTGELQAGGSPAARWLGRTLATWLRTGGDLHRVLGIRPARGSRHTPQALVRRAEINRLLLQLSVAAGGDERAVRWLRGQDVVPDSVAADVQRLHEIGAPKSTRAIQRARSLTRHPV